jgi:hypothetical protein
VRGKAMTKKSNEENYFEKYFNDLSNFFHTLGFALTSNLFIIEYPKLNLHFPTSIIIPLFDDFIIKVLCENEEDDNLSEIRKSLIQSEKNLRIKVKKKQNYDQAMANIVNFLLYQGGSLSDINIINIRDKESFRKMTDYCYIVESVYKKIAEEVAQKGKKSAAEINYYMQTGFYLSTDIMQKYFLLIGYWTAKEESRKNNPGGLAMKNRGEKNKDIIKTLLEDLEIKSLKVFRTNKTLRNKFYDMAKQLTDCDSEDRISKIARPILNG